MPPKRRVKLEFVYLMNVAMYLPEIAVVKRYVMVCRKCRDSFENLRINPNYQDSLFCRSKFTPRQRSDLFTKELTLFKKIETLRGPFSMIADLLKAKKVRYPFYDIYYEGFGDSNLLREIQPYIRYFEFACNGRFDGNNEFPVLQRLKVHLLNISGFHVHSIQAIFDANPQFKTNLKVFIVVLSIFSDEAVSLVKQARELIPTLKISVVFKMETVPASSINLFAPYANVLSVAENALFYEDINPIKMLREL